MKKIPRRRGMGVDYVTRHEETKWQTFARTRGFLIEFDEAIANALKEQWGGRFPTWQEFKTASRIGHIAVNNNVSMEAIKLPGVPWRYKITYGILTASGVFLVPLICLILAIIGMIKWWSIIFGILVGWVLFKITVKGSAQSIRYGAEDSETLYHSLVHRGAFLFPPPT